MQNYNTSVQYFCVGVQNLQIIAKFGCSTGISTNLNHNEHEESPYYCTAARMV